MLLACFFVDDSVVTTDLDGLTAVALLTRNELHPAVATLAVVPANKLRLPLTGGLLAHEWPT